MGKKEIFLFVLILVIASFPRAIELLGGNYLFGYDQGEHFLAVKKIVVDQHPTLIGTQVGGQGGFFQGAGWYYLLSIPFVITTGNPYGAMILMFLISMGVIICCFAFAKRMFDASTAVFVSILVAISPALIAQARFIWPPFPISLLTVFFLFFLFRVLQGEKNFFPLTGVIVGLMFHFEVATAGTLLGQLIILYPFLAWRRIVSFRLFLVTIGIFLVPLVPFFIFDFRHDFLIAKGVLKLVFKQTSQGMLLKYWETMFLNHLNVFSSNLISTFQLGQILWSAILGFLLFGGVFYARDKKIGFAKRVFVLYLLVSPFVLFFVFMFYPWPMWEWWILELIIFYCFLFGILIAYFWQKLEARLLIGILLAVFVGSFFLQTLNFYKNDLNDYGGTHKIKGKLDAIDYIYTNARGKPFGLLVFTPPVYTYAYDYLLWWYGGKKYKYIPPQEKKGLFYLLIEPDPSKQWSYKGWLETVIKTGKIIETKELPSGFIIQKRLGE